MSDEPDTDPDTKDLDPKDLDPKDLAFLKALVSEGPRVQSNTGLVFLIAGVVYGIQCLLIWLQMRGLVPASFTVGIAIVPTVILLIAVGWVWWKDRQKPKGGVAQRALEAAWGSAGLTNLFMMTIFGYVSYTEQNFTYWMLYATMVCAVQGAVWYIAALIRRKLWLGAVSAGWFAAALGTGFTLRQPEAYILIMAAALFLFMAIPGYVMWRGTLEPKESNTGEKAA